MTKSKSWRDVLPIHPAAELFPRMSPDDLAELAVDIEKNGLKNPVVLWRPGYSGDGSKERLRFVLDGINRLDAMERAGIRFLDDQGAPTEVYGARFQTEYEKRQVHYMALGGRRGGAVSGPKIELKTNPYVYVISANIHRRHLTAEQKRELITKLIKVTPEKSDRQIAETVKASPTTVGTVRAKMEAKGEVSKLDTRTDAKGVKQPATKPARARGPTHVCWQCRRRGKVGEVQQHHYAQYEDADVWLHDACISAFDQAEQLQRVASAAVEEHFLSSIGNKTRDEIGSASNGEIVSAIELKKNGGPPSSDHAYRCPCPLCTEAHGDIGPASAGEIERKDALIAQLQDAKRLLEIKIKGYESEIAELKAKLSKLAPPPADDGLDIPDWRAAP